MLNKEDADRLADRILQAAQEKRRPARPRPVLLMGMWRRLCPALNRLPPADALALVRAALTEQDQWPGARLALLVAPMLAGLSVVFLNGRPYLCILAVATLSLGSLAHHVLATRAGILRLLPGALENSREAGQR